jgi:hypothetical protein
MTYIVIFETDDPAVREDVSGAIKSIGEWAILSSQAMLLDTTHKIPTIMETLQPMMKGSGQLWVFTGSSPWCGHGNPIVDDHAEGYFGEAENYVPRYPHEA